MLSSCRRYLRRWPESTTAADVREPFNEASSFLYPRFSPIAIDSKVNATRFSTWTFGREKRARPTKNIRLDQHVQKRFASRSSAIPEPAVTANGPQVDRRHRRLRMVQRDYKLEDICLGWRPHNIEVDPFFDEEGTKGFTRWLDKYNENHDQFSSWSQAEEIPEDEGQGSGFVPEFVTNAKTSYRDDWLSRLQRNIHNRSAKYSERLIQKTTESMMEFLQTPSTTIPPSEHQKTLHLPFKKMVDLFGNSLGAPICLRLGTGCYVQFTSPEPNPTEGEENCIVTLHGSEYSIALAETEILSAMESLEQNPPDPSHADADANGAAAKAGGTNKSRLPVFKASGRPSNYSLVTPPPVWTIRNFADNLKYLTTLCMSPQNNALVSPVHKIHPRVVCDMIYDLCGDPKNHEYLSSEAAEIAIMFLAHHNCHKYISHLMPVFEGMVTTASMDRLLHQAARSQNLYLLSDYVQMMKRLNLNHSGREWLYIIAGLEASPFRLTLLAELNQRGLIENTKTFKWAVAVSLAPGFRAHMKEEKPFTSYIQSLDDVLGPGWLSERAINSMLFEASLMKRLDTILQILVYCEKNQIQLRSSSMNSGLLYFIHTKQLQQGIKFYFDFVATFGAEKNSRTLRHLWQLAIRRRAYNVCRVLWVYACLEGRVTTDMRDMVQDSLGFMLNPYPKTIIHPPQHLFYQNLGKVAAGVLPPPDKVTYPRTVDRFYEPPFESFSHLYSFVTGGRPRDQQLQLAERIVEDDMEACKHSYEIPPFEEMLRQAAKVDWLWGPPVKEHPRNLRRDAIHVDVRRVTRADTYRILQRSSRPMTKSQPQPTAPSTLKVFGYG